MPEIEQAQIEETAETPEPEAGTDPQETQEQEQEQEKPLQAQIDRAVTKALQTQEKRLKRETEQVVEAEKRKLQEQHLQEQGKYQELAEQRAAELAALRAEAESKSLQAQTATMLAERQLTGLSSVFDADLSTIEGRVEAAEALEKLIDTAAEARVNERLKTPRVPAGGQRNVEPNASPAAQMNSALKGGDIMQALEALDGVVTQTNSAEGQK